MARAVKLSGSTRQLIDRIRTGTKQASKRGKIRKRRQYARENADRIVDAITAQTGEVQDAL